MLIILTIIKINLFIHTNKNKIRKNYFHIFIDILIIKM